MSQERVENYFELLRFVLEKFGLFDKPGHIFNMDETGLQLNNVPGKVIAQKRFQKRVCYYFWRKRRNDYSSSML